MEIEYSKSQNIRVTIMKEYTIKQIIFALTIGFVLSWFVYQSTIKPPYQAQRKLEEQIVTKANFLLIEKLGLPADIEVIDPVNADKDVGKTYISPENKKWQVSGYYRRNELDEWHPWLMNLDESYNLTGLSVQDYPYLFSPEIIESPLISIQMIN